MDFLVGGWVGDGLVGEILQAMGYLVRDFRCWTTCCGLHVVDYLVGDYRVKDERMWLAWCRTIG